jgi:membrane protein DedA with SNARE-associated domain
MPTAEAGGWIADAVANYGYYAILLFTFLEGETILVLGGYAARGGHLDLPLVMLCAFVGSLVGDQLWFYVGRRGGRALLARRPAWQPAMTRINRHLERHQWWFILSFRFLYGLRTVAPFAIGMSSVKGTTYALLNVVAAAVWAIAVALLGYLLGDAIHAVLRGVKHVEHWVIAGLALAGLALWAWRWGRSRRAARELAARGALITATSASPDTAPHPRPERTDA